MGTLWNGTLPSLILVLNPAVQFMFYEAMKRRAGREGRKVRGRQGGSECLFWGFVASDVSKGRWDVLLLRAELILRSPLQISSAEIFLIGAIAKAIAATSTYPLQTVQTILRVKGRPDNSMLIT